MSKPLIAKHHIRQLPDPEAERLRAALAEYVRKTEFKRLLNQIIFAQENDGFRSVVILSQLPGEGRSFFVSSLALGYATLLNRRVLIVDSVSQTRNRTLFWERLLGSYASDQPQRSDLPAPRQAPNSVLGSIDRITTRSLERDNRESTDFQIGPYIESLEDQYDIVLFDTCAITEADQNRMDPIILATQADAAILLTSPATAQTDSLVRMKRELDKWSVRIVGAVYNSGPGE